MTGLKIQHEAIILDACCVINLYATGKIEIILQTLPVPVTIADKVLQDETLELRAKDTNSTEKIDLQTLIDSAVLMVVTLENDDEKAHFVNLAVELDDGEAYTGAIAIQRRWAVATDDRKGIRIFKENALQVITTPEIIHQWVEAAQLSFEEVRNVLYLIRNRTRYHPRKIHPLYTWWYSYFDAGE